jgi:pimeloyl-ACP methyl ester carboxylesterase
MRFTLGMTQIQKSRPVQVAERTPVRFTSGDFECAAWHYPGTNGACVVMAGGMAVPKEPGTDRFARKFHQAGFSVLAFDYRRFGESGGQPRQVMRIREQLEDWDAAIACACGLPEVAEDLVSVWGFSFSGGHVLAVASRNPRVAAAIAQTPTADGQAATRNALRYQNPTAALRLTGLGLLDTIKSWFSASPILVPLAGDRGTVAMLTTPDSGQGDEALDPAGEYVDWQRTVAARSAVRAGFYRPGQRASKIKCPLLVVVADDDQSALAGPAIRVAKKAPDAELARVEGGHYAPFLAAHDRVVSTELDFLHRRLRLRSPAKEHDAIQEPTIHNEPAVRPTSGTHRSVDTAHRGVEGVGVVESPATTSTPARRRRAGSRTRARTGCF